MCIGLGLNMRIQFYVLLLDRMTCKCVKNHVAYVEFMYLHGLYLIRVHRGGSESTKFINLFPSIAVA